MRILELEIENVRGIRKKIRLAPNGANTVIFGPNGSGKSAVVDAMDFLFTGDISRLTGRGSRGISLKEHGPHIDTTAKDAVVSAKVQIDGIDEPVTIRREMSKPRELICTEIDSEPFAETLEIARRGQHVLSRSEILKYIAAEASKRAEEIQAVLNLEKVENIRKLLVTIKRDSDRTLQTDKTNHETSKASIVNAIGIERFSEEEVLKKVNECRKTLNGKPIEKLDPAKLKDGISPVAQDDQIDPDLLKRTLASVNDLIEKNGEAIHKKEAELRQTVLTLKRDEKLKKDLAGKRLLDLGISLIDESGACPLCFTQWEEGKLEVFLRDRLAKAKEAEGYEKSIRDLATAIDTEVTKLKNYINTIIAICKKLKLEEIKQYLSGWEEGLSKWSEELKQAVEDYPTDDFKNMLSDEIWKEHHKALGKAADDCKELSPAQKAWDTLTALKPVLERYFDEKEKYSASEGFAEKATLLSKVYTETKDRVLENLYDSVKEDFTEYYKFLHGEDEKGFSAELKSDGPQLDLKVDFYGRGAHHPRALHSEGHQDSMGLCLYLALNKKISGDKVKLIILDDVVMSIDSSHRRNICKLLNHFFPNHQFVITTHNRTWARQLNTDGLVKKNNMVEFKGWDVNTGPKYKDGSDVWAEIKSKLDDGDVATAAHQLREHSEMFYENVCDSLRAEVRYKSDGRWELGDYLRGAKEAYKNCLKMAKKSANSWGKTKDVEEFSKMESEVNEVILRSQAEQWGINENVHYSKWGDFSKEDFLPIVEAFEDLEELFRCPECQGVLSLVAKGETPSTVKCPCGEGVSWNLETKE